MVGKAASGFVSVIDPQLAPRPVAIGVDGGLGHAQLAGDLLGAQVPVHQAKTFPLARRQKLNGVFGHFLC